MGAAGWMAFGQIETRLIATIRVDHATQDGARAPSFVRATTSTHRCRMRAKASPKRVSLPRRGGRESRGVSRVFCRPRWVNPQARTGEGAPGGLHKLESEHRSPCGRGLRFANSTAPPDPSLAPQSGLLRRRKPLPVHIIPAWFTLRPASRKPNPARLVLQRTPGSAQPHYISLMAMKSFSYLMIGVFASGLVMTLLGSVGLFSGS